MEWAIRQNSHDIDCMKTAVMAIWHHSKSSADDPDHDLCPPGENAWYGFQKDIANGTSDYTHAAPIPEVVANAILPTFEALSNETLLSQCLHGGAQNQNEAINAPIWQRATIETHASAPTVELATSLAVGHFNDGSRRTRNGPWQPLQESLQETRPRQNSPFQQKKRRRSEKKAQNKSVTGRRATMRL